MPELPEIALFARDMQKELVGRTISGIEVLQPKCLNVPQETFVEALTGAQWLDVTYRGKWLRVETSRGWLLLNLGMGGEILLTSRDHLPEKYRLVFDLDNDTCLAINFWWFGYAHYARPGELDDHKMTAKLGPNALDVTADDLRAMLQGRRGRIKSFLLNQSRLAGIGNVYVQAPLFKAGIHPLRPINTLSDDEIAGLWGAIQDTLRESMAHGGSGWELNLYGQKGRWDESFLRVGYREGQPCPACGTSVEKIKTGSTSSYICPQCQPLDAA